MQAGCKGIDLKLVYHVNESLAGKFAAAKLVQWCVNVLTGILIIDFAQTVDTCKFKYLADFLIKALMTALVIENLEGEVIFLDCFQCAIYNRCIDAVVKFVDAASLDRLVRYIRNALAANLYHFHAHPLHVAYAAAKSAHDHECVFCHLQRLWHCGSLYLLVFVAMKTHRFVIPLCHHCTLLLLGQRERRRNRNAVFIDHLAVNL